MGGVGQIAHDRLHLHPVRARQELDDRLALGRVLVGEDARPDLLLRRHDLGNPSSSRVITTHSSLPSTEDCDRFVLRSHRARDRRHRSERGAAGPRTAGDAAADRHRPRPARARRTRHRRGRLRPREHADAGRLATDRLRGARAAPAARLIRRVATEGGTVVWDARVGRPPPRGVHALRRHRRRRRRARPGPASWPPRRRRGSRSTTRSSSCAGCAPTAVSATEDARRRRRARARERSPCPPRAPRVRRRSAASAQKSRSKRASWRALDAGAGQVDGVLEGLVAHDPS